MRKTILTAFFILLLGVSGMVNAREKGEARQGVYEYILTKIPLTFREASQLLQEKIEGSPFQLVASVPMASPENCGFKARVFVLADSAYVKQLTELNPQTAPFAVLDRLNLFEDENGLHISLVNPVNINRTVLLEDEKYLDLSLAHKNKLRQLVENILPGEKTTKQYGQFRKKGYIGRTMGVMAGGPFNEKIKTVKEWSSGNLEAVLKKLQAGLQTPGKNWGLKLVYLYRIPGQSVAVLGVTGSRMESKSFAIVKAGSDKARSKFRCPGIAHAAAYPIEVVVWQEGNGIKIETLDIMYRMKMYFEDAGKWAFAKNMTMPGSIQDEIATRIEEALK